MELYTDVAYQQSKLLTQAYSSSFGMSSLLFPQSIRRHIYAIYGLVRVADEIVDTYRGKDAGALLDALEADVYASLKRGCSPNPIVHAYVVTSTTYGITKQLIAPFFASMRLDLSPQTYDDTLYARYIHGSAEVVGLMCLRVFTAGDASLYGQLEPGATRLGAAYQKVNFLRDLQADYTELGRLYFPGVSYDSFSENDKQHIIADIQTDFAASLRDLRRLPSASQKAVSLSYLYYTEVLKRIAQIPADQLKHTRVRIGTPHKLWLLIRVVFGARP